MPTPCPTDAELTAVLTGELPEQLRLTLEQHLAECAACQQQLDLMTAGDGNWLGDARAYVTAGLPAPAREVVDRMKSARPSTVEIKKSPPDLLPVAGEKPQRLGDYEILGELGRGGMGVVFKARQQSLQRDVALKVILAGQLASGAQVRRFHIEAEAAARLDHPNIVPIYEIGEHEGHHFFSMKLIEGVSLKDLRTEFQALPSNSGSSSSECVQRQRKLARLMADIARGVHHAHQRGVLHRDLKPGNILIDTQRHPHITDFGLAKLAQSDADLTLSRMVMGTPEYMSPEQAAGQTRQITTASDVYSLGAILYELLTGRPPFEADDPMLVLNRVVNESPKPPHAINPSVSRDLEIVCLKCLEKEPARRHRSAEALAEELERFERGEPIRSRAVSAPERVWRWSRRKPALAGALASLIFVFVLGFAGVVWKWRGEAEQRRLAQAATGLAKSETARAQRTAVQLKIERAEAQFHDGNSDKGLAFLAQLVRQDRTNRVAVERLMNALSYRSFCLPIASLTHDRPLKSGSQSGPDSATAHGSARGLGVTATGFRPDGRLIVTTSFDGTARIWDAATGQLVGQPLQHDAAVLWAQFSPDGTKLVTTSAAGVGRIWNVQTRQFVETTPKHAAAVRHASFNADGKRIITASADQTAQIWDAVTGQPLGEPFPHNGPVYFAAFTKDEHQVLTAEFTQDGPPAHLWDVTTRESVALPHHGREEIHNSFPQFSPLGDQVLLFDQANGKLVSLRAGENSIPQHFHHDDDVVALAFSPDGQLAATGSHDTAVRLWSTADATERSRITLHKQTVNSVQFSSDGQRLLTGSSDRTAQIWNVVNGEAVTEPMHHESAVLSAIIASNRIVTVSETDGAWLWDVPVGQPPALAWKDKRGVDFARFSRDGEIVVSLGHAGVSLLDARTGQLIRENITPPQRWRDLPNTRENTEQSPQEILDFDLSPPDSSRRRLLATASESGRTLLWAPFDPNSTRPVRQPFRNDALNNTGLRAVRCVRFSSDGKRLLTASDDGTARLWEIDSHTEVFPAMKHRGRINHAEFSPAGKLIVTASWDHTAQVWDAQTGKPVLPALNHDAEVNWAVFDPGGTRIATASHDKTVCVWAVNTGAQLAKLIHANALGEKFPFDFSPDGKLLATVAGDSLQVWETATGRSALGPLQHNSLLSSVRFSTDGHRLVTAANSGEVRIWDAQTGHALSEGLRHGARATYAEFSPDGKRLVSTSWDEHVRVWPVIDAPISTPDWLPELAEALAGQRIDTGDVTQAVPVKKLFQLRQDLRSSAIPDYFGRWAGWFFNEKRSPSGLFEFAAAAH